MPNKFRVNLIVLAAVLLPLLALSMQAFGQANATLGGTVSDTSQAVLPGATVKAVHGETGVVTTTTTNNAGIYNFPSLQPGTYQITATMQGFQTSSRTDVKLGLGSQSRLNFELVVAGVSTEVEVSTSAENLVLESGSSTGTVLQEEAVAELPLVSNDVMDLINIMGGVVKAENPIFSNSEQTFAGVPGGNINISRDGISVNEIRYSSGIVSPSRINTEMVGEFKMILSPVDAEMGRGAGQVQMITKSGANAFHGSGVWNIQNTALDANEFDNKDQTIVTEPAWRNLNNYTISASGPIIKNKTFFFATWDQQIVRSKSSVAPTSLTPCARKGIFRYFPGFQNGNALQDPQPVNSWFPSVDEAGNPVSPNGVAQLQYKSVLGTLTPTAVAQLADPDHGFMTDCAAYDFLGLANNGIQVPWDPNFRNGYDTTGYVTNFTNAMPPVNYYGTGDGLNTGGHLWTRMLKGSDTVFGSGEDNQRKSITVKIDHNISSAHRVSGTYSYETDNGEDAYRVWPQEYGGYGGLVDRQPQTFTSTLTSTLKPTLLNEFRVGLSRTRTHTNEPLSNPETGADLAQVLLGLVPNQATLFPNYADPLIIGPGSDSAAFHGGINHPYGARGNMPATWGGSDPRWTFSDTITWMKGAHSFKGGFEYRTNKSWQESNGQITFFYGGNTFPSLRGGTNWNYSPIPDWNSNTGPNWDADGVIGTPGANATQNYPMVNGMMNYMTGTVGTASQYFFTTDLNNPKWNDPTTDQFYETDLRNREISFFFKDDWKLNNSLTLNLGMRYEYYGVPWVDNGMAAGVVGNYAGMFGVSGGDLNTWMPANPDPTIGTLTQQIYIGPNSPNPDIPAFNKDSNNFAPHVGFAWQLPWFGKGKTTLRGGYSVSYTAVGNFDSFGGYGAVLSNNAGSSYVYNYTGDAVNPYLDMNNIGDFVPLPITQDARIIPLGAGIEPIDKRDQTLSLYDPDIRNPYIQNLTLSLTRNIGNNLTVDVRYIGTLSRKNVGQVNLNAPNFMNLVVNPTTGSTWVDELNIVRAGGQSATLNGMFPNGQITGVVFPAFPVTTFSDQLRGSYMTWQSLANGDFGAIANFLSTDNGTIPTATASSQKGLFLSANGQPANLFYTNPQYAGANVFTNRNHSNYHSMQAQVTMRPTRGLSFQATYTWSRNIGNPGSPTDWRDPGADYWLLTQHRSHSLSTYGTFDLPFGANGFMFRNASGALKKAVEGWQLSWITSMTTGLPGNVSVASGWTSNNTLWNNAAANLVGPFDPKSGTVTWEGGAPDGRYFGNKYMKIPDPICSDPTMIGQTGPFSFIPGLETLGSVASNCSGASGLKALALVSGYDAAGNPIPGEIIFQNALPGTRGNYQGNSLTGPGRLSVDMAISKSIEFMEGKRIDFRVDAQNIFNHATPSNGATAWNARFTQIYNPSFALNDGTDFGFISTKAGHRTFQAKIRISF